MSFQLAARQVIRLSAALVVSAALFAAPAAHAAFPGANGKIVYASDRSGDYELYAVNPDGSGTTNLTNDPDYDLDPAWSPDGTKILFVSDRGDLDPIYFRQDIYVMNADGSGVTRLTNASDNNEPEWSPDGSKIVFMSNRSSQWWGIWTMNADGSGQTPLPTSQGCPYGCGDPAWSPDGTKIVFRGYGSEIYLTNADGSGGTTMLNTGPTYVSKGAPDWSPDGAKIAFSKTQLNSQEEDCCADIWAINPDGSGLDKITNSPVPRGPYHDLPAWSPDGAKMALERGDDVYTMNADGSGMQFIGQGIVTSSGLRTDPDWQPLPTRSYAHPQSASPLQVSLVRAFRQCGIQANPVDGQHSPPLGTQACLPPVPGSTYVRVGPDSESSASFTAVPGDTDATNGDQADLALSASLSDLQTASGGDYLPNPSGPDMTEITRLRITDRANNYGGASGTTTESDFRVPIDCQATADPALGSSCSASTSADALQPGFITEQRQTVIQAFRVRVDDAGANGVPGNFDDRIFATQGVYLP